MSPSKSKAVPLSPTGPQSSAEHQSLLLSSESWTDGQRDSERTLTVSQDYAEHRPLPEDCETHFEESSNNNIMAAGRSPKHPRTGSEEETLDIGAPLDPAADRFSASMDTRIDSMMDRFEKIDERIDTKLGQVMDRLSALENTSNSTRSGSGRHKKWTHLVEPCGGGGGSTALAVFAPSYLDTWPDSGTSQGARCQTAIRNRT